MADINIANPISDIAAAATKIISLFKSDPNIKLADNYDLEKTELSGQIQIVLGQLQVNAVEAANKSIFVAGWRPYIGWICGTALAIPGVVYLIQCLVMMWHGQYDLPPFNTAELGTVLFGLLGLGGMRTYEKVNNSDAPKDIGH